MSILKSNAFQFLKSQYGFTQPISFSEVSIFDSKNGFPAKQEYQITFCLEVDKNWFVGSLYSTDFEWKTEVYFKSATIFSETGELNHKSFNGKYHKGIQFHLSYPEIIFLIKKEFKEYLKRRGLEKDVR